jgi:AcrR family transcriptional regulator
MNEAVKPTLNLRNVPTQARSRERLQRVLGTADRILAEQGSPALTITRVAEEAGISVGSLYHYFPGKDAIVTALAMHYWSDFQDLLVGVAEADEHELLEDPVAAIIDTLAAGFRARPGFRGLWYGGLRTEAVRDATRPLRTEFARTVERIVARHWPETENASRQAVARTVVLVGDGLLREAFRLDDQGDEALLTETKAVLRAYLAQGRNRELPR